ncbi:MAG: glucokinase [Blastococcus sp.]|jgi:glucokinase|nr:glucokinase [Blastococcus sp.]
MRYLGLDLGGTNIKGVVIDVGGDGPPVVIARAMAPTHGEELPDGVTARILALGRELAGRCDGIAAVGLGVPGLFDRTTGDVEFFSNLPGAWPGFPLRARLAAGLGVPAVMVNDARAFTLAEGRMGAGQGCATLVGITLGTGVGGGVLVDGRLHLGRWGMGGEIGHMLVEDGDDAAPCGCGARGCLEAYLRADVLAAQAGRASAEQVYAGARDGDPDCIAAVALACRHLGAALASLVNVLGPERIVVGGGVAAAGDTLLTPVRAEVARRLRLVPGRDVEIVPAVLGSYAGAMGAAVSAADAAV